MSKKRFNIILFGELIPISIFDLCFFIIPVFVLFIYSFWTVKARNIVRIWNFKNYAEVFTNRVYLVLVLKSFYMGSIVSIVTVIISYPFAYTLNFKIQKNKHLFLLIVLISLFCSYLVRVYAWKSILGVNGIINSFLINTGLIREPIRALLFTKFSVIVTLIHIFTPISILPIYSSLQNIDITILEAARVLGANKYSVFIKVTLPLSITGVLASFFFTFILTSGDYVTPMLLGGKSGMMVGVAIANRFGPVYNWPLGSAIAFATVFIFILLVGILISINKIYLYLKNRAYKHN